MAGGGAGGRDWVRGGRGEGPVDCRVVILVLHGAAEMCADRRVKPAERAGPGRGSGAGQIRETPAAVAAAPTPVSVPPRPSGGGSRPTVNQ